MEAVKTKHLVKEPAIDRHFVEQTILKVSDGFINQVYTLDEISGNRIPIDDSEYDDLHEAITIDEFKIQARKVVERAYKKFVNERNHTT
jgi:hypothetical protein